MMFMLRALGLRECRFQGGDDILASRALEKPGGEEIAWPVRVSRRGGPRAGWHFGFLSSS
jgi:hypothetical protein